MIKPVLEEIESDVADMKSKKFDYINTTLVPHRSDVSMTFDKGTDKTGKIITTCVLYVDIRNSVELNHKHSSQTMGRIYSAFSRAMLKLARHHCGSVRNIIGDRV